LQRPRSGDPRLGGEPVEGEMSDAGPVAPVSGASLAIGRIAIYPFDFIKYFFGAV
jgi:hypothetical protein